jgi:TonB family protein
MRLSLAGLFVALGACATVPAPAPDVTEEEATRLRTVAQHSRDCRNLTHPVLVKSVLADYPAHVRRARIQGVVFLDGVITTDGAVVGLRVVESPHPDLSAAALKAARRRRYRPAECSGQRVPTLVTIMSTFSLD